ncbi:MAG: PrsW family intramembrane metalloprotease [Treponema sp.]|nr:PrsW family intramembrane metalloprotease [Treponema sp.]
MEKVLYWAAYCFLPLIVFISCSAILCKDYKLWKALLSCLLGMLTVPPIVILQTALNGSKLLNLKGLAGVLISAIVLNGIIEECVKAALLFLLPSSKDANPKESRTKKIFFLCSLTAGLALGCLESFIYLIAGTQKIGLRMVTAVVIHTLCAGLDGLFVYGVKRREIRVLPLIIAVVTHGIYNYFAGFGEGTPYFYISFAAILFAAIECRVRYIREY